MMLIDFAAVRRAVPMLRVLGLIGWVPNFTERASWRGKCPFHPSTNPKPSRSFSVSRSRDLFHCMNKACNRAGDQIQLYALSKGLSAYQAALELCQLEGIPVPYLRGTGSRNCKGGRSHGAV